jgi:hypothetical protein
MHTAIATWSENYFSRDSYYIPAYFLENQSAPFNRLGLGFPAVDDHVHLNFGYGMSALIKYLVDNHSLREQMIVQLYEALSSSGPSFHLATLISLQASLVNQWWPDFMEAYLLGNVFDFPVQNLIEKYAPVWEIKTEEDTFWDKNNECMDISARPMRFSLTYSQMPEKAALYIDANSIEIAPDQYLVKVFHDNGSHLTHLGDAGQQILSIGNIRSMCRNREDLFLVLVNSAYEPLYFNGLSSIDLRAEIKEPSTSLYNYGTINATIWGTFQNSTQPDMPTEGLISLVWTGPGSMTSDNSFKVDDAYGTTGGQQVQVQMTVTFDPSSMAILSYSGDFASTDAEAKTLTMSIAGTGPIHATKDYPTYTAYEVSGQQTCQHISSIAYHADVYTGTNTLTAYTCQGGASLKITFVKQTGV